MQINHCTEQQLDTLSTMFNEYRIFYEYPSDLALARAFIAQNLQENRAKIFLLIDDDGVPVGFCQLYPAICSLALRPYYYLSDLYTVQTARRKGYARYLMNYISAHFSKEGAQRLSLDTAKTNTQAQRLYESLGYVREDVYLTYHQILPVEAKSG